MCPLVCQKMPTKFLACFALPPSLSLYPHDFITVVGGKRCTLIHVIRAVTLAFVDAGFSTADREASLELIKLDISRTFPNLCIFQQVSSVNIQLDSS